MSSSSISGSVSKKAGSKLDSLGSRSLSMLISLFIIIIDGCMCMDDYFNKWMNRERGIQSH